MIESLMKMPTSYKVPSTYDRTLRIPLQKGAGNVKLLDIFAQVHINIDCIGPTFLYGNCDTSKQPITSPSFFYISLQLLQYLLEQIANMFHIAQKN